MNSLTSYARQISTRILSSDILTVFPECSYWLRKNTLALHDWQITLPLISCLAAGGSFDDGIEVASAWLPICLAAHLFDHVEDREFVPDDVLHSPKDAINLGTSLIFLSFHNLSLIKKTGGAVRASAIFSSQCFAATSGQYQDRDFSAFALPTTPLYVDNILEKYWQSIILKSGSLFRTATAGGAAAGTSDQAVINALGDYGNALGVIVQLLDDGRDILKTSDDVIQGWEVSLPLLLYLLATGEEQVVFPAIHTRAEWHTCLRDAGIIEMFSTILLQWQARALESIQGLNLLPQEKKTLNEFPTLLLGPII